MKHIEIAPISFQLLCELHLLLMKIPRDEPFVCCMIFTYVYFKFFTFTKLVNNSMVSLGSFFVICVFESYIV